MRSLRYAFVSVASLGCLAGLATGRLAAGQAPPEEGLASAKQALDHKDYRAAERRAKRIAADHPKSPAAVDAWLVMIDSMTERGKLSRAFQECEKLLAAYPETVHRTEVLRREIHIGEELTKSAVWVLFFRATRLQEGVDALEKVVDHAPLGSLADHAVLAIADAQYRAGDHEAARDQYSRLLKSYPDSDLAPRARLGRTLCNYRLTQGPAYDVEPAEEASRDLKLYARTLGSGDTAKWASELLDVRARGEYEAGIFYFRRGNTDGGVRYMSSIIAKYPDSAYAGRARRILDTVRAAQSEEKP